MPSKAIHVAANTLPLFFSIFHKLFHDGILITVIERWLMGAIGKVELKQLVDFQLGKTRPKNGVSWPDFIGRHYVTKSGGARIRGPLESEKGCLNRWNEVLLDLMLARAMNRAHGIKGIHLSNQCFMSTFWGPGTVLNTRYKAVNGKSDREKQISYDITYTENLKKIQMDLLAKQK